MEKKLLSIIIPIFNVEEYLDECLTSVYRLENLPIEVILVNDGSTDNSLKVAERYLKAYPNITKLITRENGGLSAARNTGLFHASGVLIAFLDSDDFIDHVALSKIMSVAKNTNADVVAFTGYKYIHETKKRLSLNEKDNPFIYKGSVSGTEFISKTLEIGMLNTLTVWDKIYRRSTLDRIKIKFIEGIVHEDVPFTIQLFCSDVTVEYRHEQVIFYRQRSGSIMHTESDMKRKSRVYVLEKLLEITKPIEFKFKSINNYTAFFIKRSYLLGSNIKKRHILDCLSRKVSIKNKIYLSYLLLKISFKQ